MDYVDDVILLTYVIIMLAGVFYTSRRGIGMGFFTGILFAVLGYVIHIPYFNLTVIALLSMSLAAILVYKLFLEEKV